jgi:hypothetical protein
MATYKVIQDIEAEDHILGPLSLRQFIFGLIAALCFYLCYIVSTKGATFLIALFLPPGLFFAFFAIPFGRDQPTEIWALAKIRFYFKPRRRIWDQTGMKDLVTVTAPKKVEVRRTDGLSQTEVKSRLQALANTIDSRGWAVKDVDLNLYTQPGFLNVQGDSDRLIEPGSIPQPVPTYDVTASDDILDAQSNPIAHQFDDMINASTQAHRQQLVDMLQHPSDGGGAVVTPTDASQQQNSDWFMQRTTPQVPGSAQPAPIDEAALTSQLKAQSHTQDVSYDHMKVIQPLSAQQQEPAPQPAPKQPDATATRLATNNDLNISTIARVANKKDLPSEDEGEVVIPLR